MLDTLDLTTTIFAKTALGQQEIQTRALGLPPLVRRILVLTDGKRPGSELATFLGGGGDIEEILSQLLAQGCVEAQVHVQPPAAPVPAIAELPDGPGTRDISGLPPADARSPEDNEMARNFMVNTVNSIFGQHTHISLVRNISEARNTEQLRTVYHDWMASMAAHRTGSRRLPELSEKLFNVL